MNRSSMKKNSSRGSGNIEKVCCRSLSKATEKIESGGNGLIVKLQGPKMEAIYPGAG